MSDSVQVSVLPTCDIHRITLEGEVPALYDAKTLAGPWASLCQACFDRYGIGLGTGLGQRYLLRPTPPSTRTPSSTSTSDPTRPGKPTSPARSRTAPPVPTHPPEESTP